MVGGASANRGWASYPPIESYPRRAGIVPGIHVLLSLAFREQQDMDGRDKPGHDAGSGTS